MHSIYKMIRTQVGPVDRRNAFSLVEVVVAVGIFALGIVGVLGLLSPSIKSVTEVTDTTVANRLADNIQAELERLGFTAVTGALPSDSSSITLVANRDGSRVLLSTVADNNINATSSPPGILHRDRYYGITVSRFPTGNTLAYSSGSGFIALSVKVVWPYEIPAGADSTSTQASQETQATGTGSGTWRKADTTQQSVMLLNMALRP